MVSQLIILEAEIESRNVWFQSVNFYPIGCAAHLEGEINNGSLETFSELLSSVI